jgi:hypothetical protein
MNTLNATLVNTPFFVLMDGKNRLGPLVDSTDFESGCTPIYAFSDKAPYDLFLANSDKELTPYPLVQFYLRSEVELPGHDQRLVVVDAASPIDTNLHATTMSAVLNAHETKQPQIAAEYKLVLDGSTKLYKLDKSAGNTEEYIPSPADFE